MWEDVCSAGLPGGPNVWSTSRQSCSIPGQCWSKLADWAVAGAVRAKILVHRQRSATDLRYGFDLDQIFGPKLARTRSNLGWLRQFPPVPTKLELAPTKVGLAPQKSQWADFDVLACFGQFWADFEQSSLPNGTWVICHQSDTMILRQSVAWEPRGPWA